MARFGRLSASRLHSHCFRDIVTFTMYVTAYDDLQTTRSFDVAFNIIIFIFNDREKYIKLQKLHNLN